MFDVEMTQEICSHKPLEDLSIEPEYGEKHNLIDFKLHFTKKASYRIYDEFDEKAIVKNKDGSFDVTTSLPKGDWIYNYILSFGNTIEVLEPEKVGQVIVAKLENMIKKYR